MNKRIKKKVAARKCKQGAKNIVYAFYGSKELNKEGAQEMCAGVGEMYAHRMAHIKLGDLNFCGKDAPRLEKYRREMQQFIRRCERLYEQNRARQGL